MVGVVWVLVLFPNRIIIPCYTSFARCPKRKKIGRYLVMAKIENENIISTEFRKNTPPDLKFVFFYSNGLLHPTEVDLVFVLQFFSQWFAF